MSRKAIKRIMGAVLLACVAGGFIHQMWQNQGARVSLIILGACALIVGFAWLIAWFFVSD